MTPQEEEFNTQIAVARYEADRAHELALDVASANFELSFLQNTFLLNGGSATAFLAFVSLNFDKARRIVVVWEAVAICSWLLGLMVAAGAGILAYKAQKSFLRAARAKRSAWLLREHPNSSSVVGMNLGKGIEQVSQTYGEAEAIASTFWLLATVSGVIGITLFVAGVVFAACALLTWRATL